MPAYWSAQAEAEQLRDDNVTPPTRLPQKYGYLVTIVTGPEGAYLLYEQKVRDRVIRGFIRPQQWVWAMSTSSGEVLIKAKEGPPSGPKVATS